MEGFANEPILRPGMAVSIMGDSISTLAGSVPPENAVYYQGAKRDETDVHGVEDTWWGMLLARSGCTLVRNGSYSGSKVCGDAFPFGASMERAAQLSAPGSAPDAVIVFLGINDYGGGVEGGIERFERDYRRMLDNVRVACPDAVVLATTLLRGRMAGEGLPTFCTQLRGIDICAFNDRIRAAARAMGCVCLDVASFGFDYEAIDGTHPNRRGMEQIASLMAAWLTNQPGLVAEDAGLFPHWLRSSRTCELSTCMGCPFAESTTEQWSCVCNKLRHP